MERTSTETGRAPPLEGTIDETVQRFNEAFRRFDAKELASFWADEGTFLNLLGHFAKGRAGVEKLLREEASKVFEGATSTFTIVGLRRITDDCVFLDVDHDVQNFRIPDGSRGPMKMHVVTLAERTGAGWRWLDVRAYRFMHPPPSLH